MLAWYLQNRSAKKLKAKNKIIGGHANALKESLQQKELLLNEVHHRVKNNLQTIIAILGLQADAPETRSLKDITKASQDRIFSMALRHNALYENNDIEAIGMQDYLEELTYHLKKSSGRLERTIHTSIDTKSIALDLDRAVPLGLILVELVNNSLKHAFADQRKGEIDIRLTMNKDSGYELRYSDNGVEFATKLNKIKNGMGTEIIKGLVAQLKGKVTTQNNNGVETNIQFQ